MIGVKSKGLKYQTFEWESGITYNNGVILHCITTSEYKCHNPTTGVILYVDFAKRCKSRLASNAISCNTIRPRILWHISPKLSNFTHFTYVIMHYPFFPRSLISDTCAEKLKNKSEYTDVQSRCLL
jgi:hypothetical protein